MKCDIDSYKLKLGETAPDFVLPGVDGEDHSLGDFGADVLVVFWGCNHCPYVLGVEQRLMGLVEEFGDKVDFVEINSNDATSYPQDSFEGMVEHAQEKGFTHMYLHDEDQTVAKSYGAQCTPHFFVFDKDRKLVYQGTLDDNVEDASSAQNYFLRDAIKAALSQERAPTFTGAIGCSVKWKH